MAKCKSCGEEIILIPSANERARKCGGKPADYTTLFEKHANCEIADRKWSVLELIRKLRRK